MLRKVDREILRVKLAVRNFFEGEQGEANIIAVILLVLVAIALVTVFGNRMADLVNALFNKIFTDQGLQGSRDATFSSPLK